ncbi:hypothetical protein [Timonella sp. A28]|uniref:hypothetical protein n=1 Tax=Timonella sp. A28 TaxID=3442640 RepID=UPI003EC0133C
MKHRLAAACSFLLVATLLGCSPATDSSTSSTTSKPSTNTLKTSEGLTIFGKEAQSYSLTLDGKDFQRGDEAAISKTGLSMSAYSTPCTGHIRHETQIDKITYLAVKVPKKNVCDAEARELNPDAEQAGVDVSGKFTPFTSTEKLVPGDKPRMVIDMGADEKTVYWLETDAASQYQDTWRLFSADLDSKKSKVLLTAEDALDLHSALPTTYAPYVAVKDDRVYFTSYIPSDAYREKAESGRTSIDDWDEKDFIHALVSVKTDGSDFRIEAKNVHEFDFSQQGVAYITSERDEIKQDSEEAESDVVEGEIGNTVYSMVAGESSEVAKNSEIAGGFISPQNQINAFAAVGDTLTFSRGTTVYAANIATQQVDIVDVQSLFDTAFATKPNIEIPDSITEIALNKTHSAFLLDSASPDAEEKSFLFIYNNAEKTGTYYLLPSTASFLEATDERVTFWSGYDLSEQYSIALS